MFPELVIYETVDEYRQHYEKYYCKRPVITFDGIRVFFPKNKFTHAFYESSDRRGAKDVFSLQRAQRIDWIKNTLQCKEATLYQGWNARKKSYFADGRVSVVYENFVVIIRLSLKKDGSLKGNFVTCYQADNSINKIRMSPLWHLDECLELLRSKKK